MKENKIGNTWHVFVKSILHILLKSHTKNYHPTSLKKRVEGSEVWSTTLIKLPQNCVMWIEMGGPNNFAQIITILRNVY